jgi:hypothetical protein
MAPALPYIAVAMTAIGTGVSAYGQIQQGKSQAAQAEYNAKLAKRNAKSARESAEYEARQKRRGTARLIGRQRALYAKAGVTMEGSPLDVLQETAAQGEMDALMIERGYAQQEAAYKSQSELAKMRARNYRQQGYFGAGSTLLTGGGQIMGGYGGKK